MQERKKGSIIFIASVAGLRPMAQLGAYSGLTFFVLIFVCLCVGVHLKCVRGYALVFACALQYWALFSCILFCTGVFFFTYNSFLLLIFSQQNRHDWAQSRAGE